MRFEQLALWVKYLGCHAQQRTDDLRFFGGIQDGAQVQKHAAFFHAGNNRRMIVAEPCGEFVGAERFSGNSQQESRQGRSGRGTAADKRFARDDRGL